MKIAIGCDHSALDYKNTIRDYIASQGHDVTDVGTYTTDSCDYPDYAAKVCTAVQNQEAEAGIVICGTGIGVSIAANKHKGIRCALCHEAYSARLTRQHNDANVLAIGARVTGIELAKDIVDAFLGTEFPGDERHARRIAKIHEIEAAQR